MLVSTQIERRQREIGRRAAEISLLEGEAYTTEIAAENRSLATEYVTAGERLEAARIAEATEFREGGDPRDAQEREIDNLVGNVRLAAFMGQAIGWHRLDGREAELKAEMRLGDKAVPIAALAPRVSPWDAAQTQAPTTLPSTAASVLGRIFATGDAEWLGVRFENVPGGERDYPMITTGGERSARAEGGERSGGRARAHHLGDDARQRRDDGRIPFLQRRLTRGAIHGGRHQERRVGIVPRGRRRPGGRW